MPLTTDRKSPAKKKFKQYPSGYLHVDFAEVRTEEGKLYLFVVVDRTGKAAFAELQPKATKAIAADFLRRVLAALPYKVHTILTDNGTQFGNMPHQPRAFRHIFNRLCDQHIRLCTDSPRINLSAPSTKPIPLSLTAILPTSCWDYTLAWICAVETSRNVIAACGLQTRLFVLIALLKTQVLVSLHRH